MVERIENWNEDIVCSRDADGIHTNVPRRITYHSPDGFEWGYGGSGPADFALNILSIFMGQEEAWKYHQDFKWAAIARMPPEGGIIRCADILEWIKKSQESTGVEMFDFPGAICLNALADEAEENKRRMYREYRENENRRKKETEELNKKLKVKPPCPHYEPLNYIIGAACYNCIHCLYRRCTITGKVKASYEEMC